jgi:hypothetical protein
MRRGFVFCLLAAQLLSSGGAVMSSAQVREFGSDEQMMIALDLMDLDIPGEGSGDQMELPPIEEPVTPADEALPSIPEQKPPEVERTRTGMPADRAPVRSSGSGIAPFLLDESRSGAGVTEAATRPPRTDDFESALEEIPAELKTVPPPPSRSESLKLPSGTGVQVSGEADLPEIPLLKGEDRAQPTPVSGGQGSGLSMKPIQGLDGTPVLSPDSRSPRQTRRAEDYLQVREDYDSQLFEIYDRFYKKR